MNGSDSCPWSGPRRRHERRRFPGQSVAAGAVLTLGINLNGCGGEAPPDAGGASFAPDAWVRIHTEGSVVVMVDRSEMGQGVSTALPLLVAEELDADWETVRFEFAPAVASPARSPVARKVVTVERRRCWSMPVKSMETPSPR